MNDQGYYRDNVDDPLGEELPSDRPAAKREIEDDIADIAIAVARCRAAVKEKVSVHKAYVAASAHESAMEEAYYRACREERAATAELNRLIRRGVE